MKLKFAFICAAAAAVVGLASSASAAVEKLTFNWAGGPTEVLTLDLAAGQADAAGPNYVEYSLLSDSLGNNGIFFGDTAARGWVGTGHAVGSPPLVNQAYSAFFSPALYSGSGLVAAISLGNTYTATDGSTLTVAAVPEASTWAMMLMGVGIIGGRMRMVRRQNRMLLSAA